MTPTLPPVDTLHNNKGIPIVFSTDNNYIPYLSVVLQSIICHANDDRLYDLVVMHDGISEQYKQMLETQCRVKPNITLRFYHIEAEWKGYQLPTDRLSMAAYYRLCIPEIMVGYDKVLYLDIDLIVKCDIAELYDTNLGDHLIGACRDFGMMYFMNSKQKIDYSRYFKQTLGLENLSDYVNSGVLLFNIRACREWQFTEKTFAVARDCKILFEDQDMINKACQGRIKILDAAWNYAYPVEKCYIPSNLYEQHVLSAKSPKIQHYMSSNQDKPWNNTIANKYADIWWDYAAQTAFYREIVHRYMKKMDARLKELHESFSIYRNISTLRRKYLIYKIVSFFTCGGLKKRVEQRAHHIYNMIHGLR